MPSTGLIICCSDHENVRSVIKDSISQINKPPEILWYGESKDSDFLLTKRELRKVSKEFNFSESLQEIEFIRNSKRINLETKLTGKHNALNIIAAYAVCVRLGVSDLEVNKALSVFSSIKRRQQKIFESKNYLLLEDFAHHPEEVKTTISGIKESYLPTRLVAIFEPRSNTSRRAFFLEDYKVAFNDADVIFIKEIKSVATGFAGLAKDVGALNVEELKQDLVSRGKIVYTSDSVPELEKMISENLNPGDLLLIMSNGDFEGLPSKINTLLSTKC